MIVRTNALKTLIYQHNHMCLNPYVPWGDVYTLHTCCHRVKVNFHILEMHLLGFIIFHKNLKCRPYIVGCPQDDVIPEQVWNTIPMWSRIVEHHQNWFIWVIRFYPFEIFDCISKDNTVVLFELCEHMFCNRLHAYNRIFVFHHNEKMDFPFLCINLLTRYRKSYSMYTENNLDGQTKDVLWHFGCDIGVKTYLVMTLVK